MLIKLKGYLIAFGAALLGIIAVFFAGRKAGRDAVNIDNAEYQKEKLKDAYEAKDKSHKEGLEVRDEALQKADNDDFTGFNDKL